MPTHLAAASAGRALAGGWRRAAGWTVAALVALACLGGTESAQAEVGGPDEYRVPSLAVLKASAPRQFSRDGFENVVHRRALAFAPAIDAAARKHGVDPLLMHAVTYVESGYRPELRSSAGAVGLMQILPETARRFGVKDGQRLYQPAVCVQAAAGYLRWLLDRFDNNLPLAIAAYNAGEGNVERYGMRVPPFRETRAYVRSVLGRYEVLRTVASQNGAQTAAVAASLQR